MEFEYLNPYTTMYMSVINIIPTAAPYCLTIRQNKIIQTG